VSLKHRVFCLISEIYSDRRKVLDQIKNKTLSGPANPLNTSIIYAHKLDPDALARVLSGFSFCGKKLIVIKDADKLDKACKALLEKEFKLSDSLNVIVLEIEKDPWQFSRDKKISKDLFFQAVLKQATVVKSRAYKEQMTFYKLTSALQKRQMSSAFYILETLFLEYKNDRALGMQLIGTLVRHFSSLSDPHKKETYLSLVWKADRLIKEKGIEPRLALEMLLTEICAI